MKIGQAFPSKFLSASDLEDDGMVVTIKDVQMEDVGDDNKPIVYFKESAKGMVLNKTNAEAITQVLGSDDTDDWPGKRIKIYPTTTSYQGKPVECIRVHLRPPQQQQQQRAAAVVQSSPQQQRQQQAQQRRTADDPFGDALPPPITEDDITW